MNKVYVIEAKWWDTDANLFVDMLEDNVFYTSYEKAKKICDALNYATIQSCLRRQKDHTFPIGYTEEVINKLIEQWHEDLDNALDEGTKITDLIQTFEYCEFHYVTELESGEPVDKDNNVYLCDWYDEVQGIFDGHIYEDRMDNLLVDVNRAGIEGRYISLVELDIEAFKVMDLKIMESLEEKK